MLDRLDPKGLRHREVPDPVNPVLRHPLCDTDGIRRTRSCRPGWAGSPVPALVSATANAGALGILASATMDIAQLSAAIAEVKARTASPFGVNLRADSADIDDRIALMIDEGVKVASFAQAPKPALISRLKDAGLVVIPSIGAKRHAEKVLEWGVDAVLVQGGEGGGHTGSVPTTLLLPQVVDAIAGRIPVIAAGGFFDGRGLVAALAYGADGHRDGNPLPAHVATPRCPQAVKDVYLGKGGHRHCRLQAGRRGPPPSAEHRAGRGARIGPRQGASPCRERCSTRIEFRQLTGLSPLRRCSARAWRCATAIGLCRGPRW